MPHILMVEDNYDNAEILTIYLESQDLTVQHIPDGHDVLGLVMQNPPDLIFMDINLPDNDGRVICNQIKKRLGKTAPPIIIMTADHSPHTENTANALGADRFIQKPFARTEIMEILGEYLPALISEK